MLPLNRPPLTVSTQTALAAMCASYAKSGSPKWDSFRANRVRRAWKVFDEVWSALGAMSFGKCALCEKAGPWTVEHVAPKANPAHKALVFAWGNLLPACDNCNAARQRSGVAGQVLDPSAPPKDLLDVLGWTRYGVFESNPAYAALVNDTVVAYDLARFNADRQRYITNVEMLLKKATIESELRQETREALQSHLCESAPHLGPVREYLLRPRTDQHRLLIRVVFKKHPFLQTLVAPWLRPPPGLLPPWLP